MLHVFFVRKKTALKSILEFIEKVDSSNNYKAIFKVTIGTEVTILYSKIDCTTGQHMSVFVLLNVYK